MVGEGGALPLPWLAEPLREILASQRSHALLLQGAAGVGQFELATSLAQSWLCEAAEGTPRPCGRCASCKLVQAHSHPDLMIVLPDLLREQLGWAPAGADDGGSSESKSKAKPSKDIRVEQVRAIVAFAQSSSARGRAKAIVVYPAERMNSIAANTLLKTLEEPPGMARFVLTTGSADTLLPTIRSRCQGVHLPLPESSMALGWLQERGVKGADVLLAAAGGQPLEAQAYAAEGLDAAAWQSLPGRLASGDGAAMSGWPLPRVVDALQKLCHDAMLMAAGSAPRYFPLASMASIHASLPALAAWSKRLASAQRQAEHPWNAGLMVEALAQDARGALRNL